MTDTPKCAFKTTDPAVIAAWKQAAEQIRDIGNRAVDEAQAIGKNKGLMVQTSFGTQRFVGLSPIDPADPPQGWRHVRGQFEPRLGKAGDSARAWLESVQRPAMRKVMADYGLPEMTSTKYGFWAVPAMFLHGDAIYAMYKGEPEGMVGSNWEPIRPSEFYAAQEQADATEAMAR